MRVSVYTYIHDQRKLFFYIYILQSIRDIYIHIYITINSGFKNREMI